LRPLSLDELPDLSTDGVERCEQALVRLPNFMAEKFHHAEEPTRTDDGEGECPVKPFLRRVGRAREVGVSDHVFYPDGLDESPHPSRQTDAARKRRAAVDLYELTQLRGRGYPHPRAAHRVPLRINRPMGTEDPIECLADRSQDTRHRVFEAF